MRGRLEILMKMKGQKWWLSAAECNMPDIFSGSQLLHIDLEKVSINAINNLPIDTPFKPSIDSTTELPIDDLLASFSEHVNMFYKFIRITKSASACF